MPEDALLLDAHMLESQACREADEPCSLGEALFKIEDEAG